MVEDFLLSILDMHGLNRSDIMNIALEKYLISQGYLNSETLSFINSLSYFDKLVFTKGLI